MLFCYHVVVKEWYCKEKGFLVRNSKYSENLNKPVDNPQSIIFCHFMICNGIQSCQITFLELYWTFDYSLISFIIMQIINYSLLKRPLLFLYFNWKYRRYPGCFHSSHKNYLSFLSTLRSSFRLIFIVIYVWGYLSLVRDMISVEIFFFIRNLNKFTFTNIRSPVG